MLRYIVNCPNPSSHFIQIEVIIDGLTPGLPVAVCLPLWRPGRYEMQNYPKNVRQFKAYDIDGSELIATKTHKGKWQIATKGNCEMRIVYEYYAHQLDAGASYVNHAQWYINPCNCMLYVEGQMNNPCELYINAPNDYEIAISLPQIADKLYIADSFHLLADSPFIASPNLQKETFKLGHCIIYIWFQGNIIYNAEKLLSDFEKFCKSQLDLFGDLECSEYHFFFQMLPYPFHHGVEHANSTVIAMGPNANFNERAFYREFLGISSHEFFHLWNVKRIRPVDMLPYNYETENYSTLGWVYEGFTTYYGDLICIRSGIYSQAEWLETFNKHLQRHFDNAGRYHLTLAQSSFDTWLDGYSNLVPHRKVNIYTEGLLSAFILDMSIREETDGKNNLDDIMRDMYAQYKNGVGYSLNSIKQMCETITQKSCGWFFDEVINGCGYIEQYLPDALQIAGLSIQVSPNNNPIERVFGFKYILAAKGWQISAIWPGSAAYSAGLDIDDIIVSINGQPNTNEVFADDIPVLASIILEVENLGVKRILNIAPTHEDYYSIYSVNIIDEAAFGKL